LLRALLKLGSLEAWKLGSLEAWKLGSLEAWKLYTVPMRRRQAHFQGIMSLRGVFMGWRFGVQEVVKKRRGPAGSKKKW
jgi:hypothetical protein